MLTDEEKKILNDYDLGYNEYGKDNAEDLWNFVEELITARLEKQKADILARLPDVHDNKRCKNCIATTKKIISEVGNENG